MIMKADAGVGSGLLSPTADPGRDRRVHTPRPTSVTHAGYHDGSPCGLHALLALPALARRAVRAVTHVLGG